MGNNFSSLVKVACEGNKRKLLGHIERHRIKPNEKVERCADNCGKHCHEQMYFIHYSAAFFDQTEFTVLMRKQQHKYQAFVDLRTPSGKTPAMYAAIHGNVQSLKVLIQLRCDLNTTDVEGDTALHLAVRKGYIEIVQTLLKEDKINIDIENDHYNTAVDDARHYKRFDIQDMLESHYRNVMTQHRGSLLNGRVLRRNESVLDKENMRRFHNGMEVSSSTLDSGLGRSERIGSSSSESNDTGNTGVVSAPTDQITSSTDKASQKPAAVDDRDGLLCKKYSKKLQKVHDKIMLHLEVEDLVIKMFTEELITHRMRRTVESEKEYSKKINLIVNRVHRLSNSKFERFLELLEETGQEALASTIRNAAVEELSDCEEEEDILDQSSSYTFCRSKSDRTRPDIRQLTKSCINLTMEGNQDTLVTTGSDFTC